MNLKMGLYIPHPKLSENSKMLECSIEEKSDDIEEEKVETKQTWNEKRSVLKSEMSRGLFGLYLSRQTCSVGTALLDWPL